MITAVAAALDHGRAAKLAAPDHKRILEQPALFQILYESRAGLVGILAVALNVLYQMIVLIPGLVIELDEADAAFHQEPRQQTIVGERRFPGLGTVQLQNLFRLA